MSDSATAKFPAHFARDTAPHSLRQIRFASQAFNATNVETTHQEALEKFRQQTQSSLPAVTDDQVNNFLNQNPNATNEYQALASEYKKLQKIGNKPFITAYIKAAQGSIKDINEKFELYVKQQKKSFHDAYKNICPDEKSRNELWKKYEANLRKYIMEPVDKFSKDIHTDHLLSQSMIYYLSRLALKDNPIATNQHALQKEKFIPRSHYVDSKDKIINVQYDKKTGKATEIRVDALSGTFFGISGKALSGDLGDAFAVAVASHGKNIPIKIVVPVTQSDILKGEMDPGLMQGLVILVAWLFQKLEQRHYRNRAVEGAVEKGIPLENISLVTPHGEPIPFSDKLKEEVRAKQAEWTEQFAKLELDQEKSFNEQPHLRPAMAGA